MNDIISKIITATHLIDQAEELGMKNEITIKDGGLSLRVSKSVSGTGYYLTGYFTPQAHEWSKAAEDE